MNKKRGVSLLISFVLLISFTILMAAFITTWSVERVKEVPLDELGGEYCDDVMIDVKLSRDSDTITLDIENRGVFSIHRFTVQRETDISALGSCDILNPDLQPGALGSFQVNLGGNLARPISCNDDSLQSAECIAVKSLSIVPWVEIEEEDFACGERKISFSGDEEEILRLCPS